MDDVVVFAIWIGQVCLVLLLATVSNRGGRRHGVPAPEIFSLVRRTLNTLVVVP